MISWLPVQLGKAKETVVMSQLKTLSQIILSRGWCRVRSTECISMTWQWGCSRGHSERKPRPGRKAYREAGVGL